MPRLADDTKAFFLYATNLNLLKRDHELGVIDWLPSETAEPQTLSCDALCSLDEETRERFVGAGLLMGEAAKAGSEEVLSWLASRFSFAAAAVEEVLEVEAAAGRLGSMRLLDRELGNLDYLGAFEAALLNGQADAAIWLSTRLAEGFSSGRSAPAGLAQSLEKARALLAPADAERMRGQSEKRGNKPLPQWLDDSRPAPSPQFHSGSWAAKGARATMEDEHVAFDSRPGASWAFFAVYDGHGGRHVANLAKSRLHGAITDSPAFARGDVFAAIRAGFAAVDAEALRKARREGWRGGSTAACALCLGSTAYVANTGDTEVVFARQDPMLQSYLLSAKHRPGVNEEKMRIIQAGGTVRSGRIWISGGSLAVSRALGDFPYRFPENGAKDDFVSAKPHIRALELNPGLPFFIIACDGFWDVTEYHQAVMMCAIARGGGKSAQQAAKTLVEEALRRGSKDNITCVVVYIDWS